MTSAGNFIGTSSVCAPVRSALGCRENCISGSGKPQSERYENVLTALRALRGGDWQPVAVARAQEALGEYDFVLLHGYIVIELGNIDDRSKPHKFIRVDWGADGLGLQVQDTDETFVAYAPATHTVAYFGIAVPSAFPLASKLARLAEVRAKRTGKQDIPIKEAVVVGIMIRAFAHAAAKQLVENRDPTLRYEHVDESSDKMKELIRMLESHQACAYDLIRWNCNHFANCAFELLAGSRVRTTSVDVELDMMYALQSMYR